MIFTLFGLLLATFNIYINLKVQFLVNVSSRSLCAYIAHLSVCRMSVVHSTQPVEIFNNVTSLFGTLATH